jgi:hypothetical protein
MKKLALFITMLFLMACSSPSEEIKQNIGFDNITNNYSITTSFNYPNKYSSCVYSLGPTIDSVRIAEQKKAEYIQEEMIKKSN